MEEVEKMENQLGKTIRINQLLDLYGQLLTPKQYDYMDCYYGDDLSLAEIAEEMTISRAAVHDQLKRGELQLETYEQKLQLLQKTKQRTQYYDLLAKACNQQNIAEVEHILFELNKIEGREV